MGSRRLNGWIALILALAVSSYALSYVIHFPDIPGNIYSDIVSFYFRDPLIKDVKIPYIELDFEYPPLAGLMVYLAAVIGRGELVPYYIAISTMLFVFYIVLVLTVTMILLERSCSKLYLFIFLIFAPSIIVYGNYNFDIAFTALLMLSIWIFEKGKLRTSALLFSAAMLTKLVNVILLPFLLLRIQGWKRRAYYLLYAILPFTIVNLVLLFLNPKFIDGTYFYHARWGLENAWYVYLFPSPDSWNAAKIFGALLMAYGLIKVYLCEVRDIYLESFMLLSVFLLASYIFTPQMVIFILPFLAILNYFPTAFIAFEPANVGIILTWFLAENPIAPGSMPQNLALIRAIALFFMLIEVYFRYRGTRSFREYFMPTVKQAIQTTEANPNTIRVSQERTPGTTPPEQVLRHKARIQISCHQ